MLSPIIIVIIVIIAALILFKLLKSLIKAVLIAVGIGFLLLLIVGLIAYSDVKQVTTALKNGDKALIYSYEGEEITGITADNSSPLSITAAGTLPLSLVSLSPEQLANYSQLRNGEGDFNEDLIMIIDHDWLWRSIDEVTALNTQIDEDQFKAVMLSDDPQTTWTEQTSVVAPPGADIKNILFLAAFHSSMKHNPPQALLTGIRDGEIITSPDFISVGIIKLIPDETFTGTLNQTLRITRFDQEEQQ